MDNKTQEALTRAQQVIRANNEAVKTLVRGKYGSSNDYYVIRYVRKSKKGSDA